MYEFGTGEKAVRIPEVRFMNRFVEFYCRNNSEIIVFDPIMVEYVQKINIITWMISNSRYRETNLL